MFKLPNIDLVLNDNVPVLDPYICDMQHQVLTQDILDKVVRNLVYKLRGAGFDKDYDVKLISQHSFDFSIPGIEYCIDKFCPNEIVFLLTFSADGMHFITPPYDQDKHKPMSWNEYIFRIFRGEKLSLLIRAPWAQAKFVNVVME